MKSFLSLYRLILNDKLLDLMLNRTIGKLLDIFQRLSFAYSFEASERH